MKVSQTARRRITSPGSSPSRVSPQQADRPISKAQELAPRNIGGLLAEIEDIRAATAKQATQSVDSLVSLEHPSAVAVLLCFLIPSCTNMVMAWS